MKSGGYERVAPLYDTLAAAYSWGAIRRTKASHVPLLGRGQHVLYAGAGTCSEGLLALGQGAAVTLVDQSLAMLDRARRRYGGESSRVQFLHQDVFDLVGRAHFDHVVAPFFLNVFGQDDVVRRLSLLARLLKRSGRLTIADFRAPQTGLFATLQRAYYLPPLWLFGLLTGNPRHPLYDYRDLVARTGLPLRETHHQVHRVAGVGLYESITFSADITRTIDDTAQTLDTRAHP